MKQILDSISIKLLAFGLMALPLAIAGLVATSSVSAQIREDPSIQASLCDGSDKLQIGDQGTCDPDTEEEGINELITNIINIISIIVGIVAVIMIIYGGFRYITAGGDSGRVNDAKNTILYALIGLIIVALAQFIVRFVISQTTDITESR